MRMETSRWELFVAGRGSPGATAAMLVSAGIGGLMVERLGMGIGLARNLRRVGAGENACKGKGYLKLDKETCLKIQGARLTEEPEQPAAKKQKQS